MTIRVPATPAEFDAHVMQELIQAKHPDATVLDARVLAAAMTNEDGQQVSSAQRVFVEVDYGAGSPDGLPKRLLVKIARPDFGDLPLYRNEVNAYIRLGDELPVTTPQCVGGFHDAASGAKRDESDRYRAFGRTVGQAACRVLGILPLR